MSLGIPSELRQAGSYLFARRISPDKHAWSHAFPGTHLILELSRYADLNLAAGAADASRAMLRTLCLNVAHPIAVLAHAHF